MTAESAPPAPRRPRLLVLNDDTPFLELMHALLAEDEGYEVLVRKEWSNAYELVKEHHPDLVILDIVMGREERGWSILNLLTLDPETSTIPVLVCSAAIHSLEQHAPFLEKHGIRALAKPFDLEELLSAIEAALAGGPRPAPGEA